MSTILGVHLSTTLDIGDLLGAAFARLAPDLDLRAPDEIDDPAAVRFAIAWEPAADAFRPYANLELIGSIAAGVDSILGCPSLPADVPVIRIRDPEQAEIMAGFVTWNVLWWHRRFDLWLADQRAGHWQRRSAPQPSKIRVGILGFGLMAQATARTLVSLGYPVAAWARSRRAEGAVAGVRLDTGADGLDRVVGTSDVLVDLLPLTDETRGILSRDLLAKLPDGAALIHVGRGDHLDEEALLAELDAGRLRGASIDVFKVEPLPAAHRFWRHPNVVVTPHDAAEANFDTTVIQIAEQMRRIAAGEPPLDPVDRARGY